MSSALSHMPVIARVGTAGLFAYAFGGFASTTLAELGMALMVVAFVIEYRSRYRQLWTQPIVRLALVFFLYMVLRTVWAVYEFPEQARQHLDFGLAWMGLWLFIVVAHWWDLKKTPALLGLILLGFCLSVAYELTGAELSALLKGEREGFGFGIPQAGLFSAGAVVGAISFGPRFFRARAGVAHKLLRFIAWLVLLLALVEMLVATQSRISWIAALAVAPVVCWLVFRNATKKQNRWIDRRGVIALALVSAAIAGVFFANADIVERRVQQYTESVRVIEKLDQQAIAPEDSVGIRIELLRHGFARWSERPWFGWGPGARVSLGAERIGRNVAHLHNAYLEMLARLGIVGVLFYAVAIAMIVRALWAGFRENRLPVDYLAFVLGALTVLAVWFTANFRLTSEVRFLFVVLLGMGYRVYLQSHAVHRLNATPTDRQ